MWEAYKPQNVKIWQAGKKEMQPILDKIDAAKNAWKKYYPTINKKVYALINQGKKAEGEKLRAWLWYHQYRKVV